jgi:uncharacterized protein (TIGR00725 family)
MSHLDRQDQIRGDLSEPRVHYIAVVGPGDADRQTCELAAEAGRLIARRGAVVVCGGLGGVMEAAARGARELGGASLGILPGRDRTEANAYLTLAVASGLGELRNGLLVRASDAVLAIGGSWGTLSELALALRLDLPVVSLGGWNVVDSGDAPVPGLMSAGSPAAAVEAVFARLG